MKCARKGTFFFGGGGGQSGNGQVGGVQGIRRVRGFETSFSRTSKYLFKRYFTKKKSIDGYSLSITYTFLASNIAYEYVHYIQEFRSKKIISKY